MRKLFILMMAFLLPVSALEMRADETKVDKILIRVDRKGKLSRDVDAEFLAAYYVSFSCIQTTVTEDLGEVELIVKNLVTGDSWNCSFDSATQPQSLLPISGSSGCYEIEYITESGDVYSGEFLIE